MGPNEVPLSLITSLATQRRRSNWQLMSTETDSLIYSRFTVENDDYDNSLVRATVIATVHEIKDQCGNHYTHRLRTLSGFYSATWIDWGCGG